MTAFDILPGGETYSDGRYEVHDGKRVALRATVRNGVLHLPA